MSNLSPEGQEAGAAPSVETPRNKKGQQGKLGTKDVAKKDEASQRASQPGTAQSASKKPGKAAKVAERVSERSADAGWTQVPSQ